jgi:hypothetical protein
MSPAPIGPTGRGLGPLPQTLRAATIGSRLP